MEKLMQYVWQHRLLPRRNMMTVDGRPVRVIDPGRLNTNSGPDFFNAKIDIDGKMWAGDVEIHVKASDWHRHKHDNDPAYDSVILHVVDRDDTMIRRRNGEVIPQMCMPCSPNLNADYRSLVERADIDLPCGGFISKMTPIYLTDWLSSLTYERLYAKSDHIDELRNRTGGNIEEACYIIFARCLGFGTNSEPFERLARSLPLKFLWKHGDSLLSIEALLFGQAGLLPADTSRLAGDPDGCRYVTQLVKEYAFLSHKFGLKTPENLGWKMGRMRPQNFPHRRIAFLARAVNGNFRIYSRLLELKDIDEARSLFDIKLNGYWSTHYHFTDRPSPIITEGVSRRSVDLLIINLVAPMLFNHGLHSGDDRFCAKGVDFLNMLPAENNTVIELFKRAGVKVEDAASSQALIHLRRNYCETRKCLYCRLGHRVLSEHALRH